MVTWSEWRGGIEIKRTGQVWSGCPKSPGAVWVAPADGGPAVALSKTLDVLL